MHDQPRFEPLEKNPFFTDQRAMRPQVPGTVARGQLVDEARSQAGRVGGELATAFPFVIGREDLERGRRQFEVFCSPCHGRLGSGDGMVVRRGFQRPPTYHSSRLRQAPVGHFFEVISNGFGNMGDFSDRIAPPDRWRIAAYIRVLQTSQHSRLDELPGGLQQEFRQATTP
jgi:mono/diheme cytochrome c family protein